MLPIINIEPLLKGTKSVGEVVTQISQACRRDGFFYVTGHDVPTDLIATLKLQAEQFFASTLEEKQRIAMNQAGPALRGYFGIGDELTSGVPDVKEGLYFGENHDDSDPRVMARVPLYGTNLYPDIEGFGQTIEEYMVRVKIIGDALMRGVALSLGLAASFFQDQITQTPTQLFRIFHYPAVASSLTDQWGVGEHTDYGLLTLLLQDDVGGLQVKTRGQWQDAPPVEGTFVCNIGDMLDRMTSGRYRSTPHRVCNTSGRSRYSFPFFYDPDWTATVSVLPGLEGTQAGATKADSTRWDGQDLSVFDGTYGEYISRKVGKVFPHLFQESP